MKVHQGTLSETDRYIEADKRHPLEDKIPQYQRYLRFIEKGGIIPGAGARMLEVGVGTGWFPLLCKLKGLQCKGLEISPQLIEVAMETGRAHGVVPDIELGNIEESDLGAEQYDVVVAAAVFEHIEFWVPALEKLYATLRPGGVLFFESSNKFSLLSGEYKLPLYGWLPNALRYRLRMLVHGPDVMKLGIDFNQFTYFGLRRQFLRIGFSRILDRVDLADLHRMRGWKRALMAAGKRNALMKSLLLCFAEGTTFVCVK